MNYTAEELARITQSTYIGDGEACIKNIVFDSRNIYSATETAFIALKTPKNNGEKYIESAIEKGITTIISENKTTENSAITWIITKDSLQFLQNLAQYHLGKHHLKTIGITGSNGKTIVKEWLYQCLSEDTPTVKSPKSYNSQLGLPLSLLRIEKEHEIGIFEVGISLPGEMENLEGIFQPQIGVFTHLGSAHISNFESDDQLLTEKIKLFQHSETIIFNGDHPLVKNKINKIYPYKKLVSFGLNKDNDLKIIHNENGKDIIAEYFGQPVSFPANNRNEATLNNALCIIAVLKDIGYSNEKIVTKLNTLRSVEMRLESVNGAKNNLIINDSFNLDMDSLVTAFQFVKEYNKRQKSLVLTDFAEGIKNPEGFYQKVAKLTNAMNFHKIFLVGEEISVYEKLFNAETYTFFTTEQLIDSQSLNLLENELILLKGARKFEIEKVKDHLELQKHDTVLEVNLNAILHNINVHKSLLPPQTKMMAMVKAYSYGLGGYEIAEFLQHHHIDYLGVAYVDEGIDLRKNGITVPIMVMNPEQHSYSSIIDYNLEPEIYSFRVLEQFSNELTRKGIDTKYPVHIKLESGMHRLGYKSNEIIELASAIKAKNLEVKSIFSHLSSADDPLEREFTLSQIEDFRKNSDLLILELGYASLRHILNSSGILNYPENAFDMVRIGIGMAGIAYNPKIAKLLQSAVSLKTVVSQISEVKHGESVGYNRKYQPYESTRIATIPVGYADGIPRLVGNQRGKVSINGSLVPIVGNVCMDMMMLDIGDLPVKEGDEVVIFNGNPSLSNFAEYCKTIPYEVLTSISRRVKRIYIKN